MHGCYGSINTKLNCDEFYMNTPTVNLIIIFTLLILSNMILAKTLTGIKDS